MVSKELSAKKIWAKGIICGFLYFVFFDITYCISWFLSENLSYLTIFVLMILLGRLLMSYNIKETLLTLLTSFLSMCVIGAAYFFILVQTGASIPQLLALHFKSENLDFFKSIAIMFKPLSHFCFYALISLTAPLTALAMPEFIKSFRNRRRKA